MKLLIYAAAFVLLVVIGLSMRGGQTIGLAGLPAVGGDAIRISIANTSAKQEWLHRAVQSFNEASRGEARLQLDGKPIAVEVLQEVIDGKKVDYRSGTMVTDTLEGRIKPTILSPAEEAWIAKLNSEWQAIHGRPASTGQAPILARTPMVVAMWQSRARALGCWPTVEERCTWETIRTLATSPTGWEAFGQPAWRKFKFGYGYVGESNSGTLSVVLMCMLGVGKTSGLALHDVDAANGCGRAIADFETAKVHSGKKSDWLLGRMRSGGPEYLDAIVTNETEVIGFNRQYGPELREPLVSVYPRDGTILFGHPFAVLNGVPWVTPEQVRAAGVFRDFLLTSEQQEAVVALGLRPGESTARLGSPIEATFGANPYAALHVLELPDPLVVDRVIELWHVVKKPAVIAVVFDKSGSMAGAPLSAAIAGAKAFIERMDRVDWLLWMPFDDKVYSGARGTRAEVGERLIQEIGSTTAGGGTALYEAILEAHTALQEERRQRGDTVRYGIVVLSDGKDTASRRGLSAIDERLRPTEQDPTGVQIHTIAIGGDADTKVLQRIATSAHGKFWKGKSAQDMVTIYQEIATHY